MHLHARHVSYVCQCIVLCRSPMLTMLMSCAGRAPCVFSCRFVTHFSTKVRVDVFGASCTRCWTHQTSSYKCVTHLTNLHLFTHPAITHVDPPLRHFSSDPFSPLLPSLSHPLSIPHTPWPLLTLSPSFSWPRIPVSELMCQLRAVMRRVLSLCFGGWGRGSPPLTGAPCVPPHGGVHIPWAYNPPATP